MLKIQKYNFNIKDKQEKYKTYYFYEIKKKSLKILLKKKFIKFNCQN
jgi:hypothetical protein